jgi:hypothetical protein
MLGNQLSAYVYAVRNPKTEKECLWWYVYYITSIPMKSINNLIWSNLKKNEFSIHLANYRRETEFLFLRHEVWNIFRPSFCSHKFLLQGFMKTYHFRSRYVPRRIFFKFNEGNILWMKGIEVLGFLKGIKLLSTQQHGVSRNWKHSGKSFYHE